MFSRISSLSAIRVGKWRKENFSDVPRGSSWRNDSFAKGNSESWKIVAIEEDLAGQKKTPKCSRITGTSLFCSVAHMDWSR